MINAKEMKQRLRGSISPIVTPFDSNNQVDLQAMSGLIEWHLESGSHGISVTGTTGEPSSLTLAEREMIMEHVIRTVNQRVPVVPGTGSTNHEEALHLTKLAQEMGADAALVIVPYYNRPNQQALYQHFRTIADSVDIPIILYNIPGRTGVNLEVSTLARLVEDCDNIVGIKESNKDFEHVNRVLHRCGRDFLLYSGIELLCYPMLAIGGAGHVAATANVAPKEVAELYNRWTAGDVEGAVELHYHLLTLNDVLFKDTNPVPVKTALGMMGKINPAVRLPLGPPSEALRREIEDTLVHYGILTKQMNASS
ncbi:2,4-dihydroxyhept-2-ene-1,7-dioic acid aldolase [Paenibacillus dendritiformis]|uniref:2,4-dihydroxyhept-2-ene-1,7-dioic acid aldolase n=1 Tax=Paenibacillus dendritiformis TaxID=130049 RepID=UPI00248BE01C|nr:2,4-dihydroxyhept-2-ene-1,7-dioic acid aldolase [Paenibacillus dendritiformis]WGU94461.1 2,4-dihydroxyhept-2-ene-1,7-dioic acid aldolase [Paenibacillus dendritiformis]